MSNRYLIDMDGDVASAGTSHTQPVMVRLPKARQPFVSVVIPVFNNSQALAGCLAALATQTYPKTNYEIIVVDNGSEEDVQSVTNDFEGVTLAYEAHPGSYAARNRGIASAKGKIIAFTDSDCIPTPDWIANGVTCLTQTPNCGLVAGKVEFYFRQTQHPTAAELYDSINFLQQQKYIEEAGWGATANLWTFKHVIESVGHFNHTLKSSGDLDWGNRVSAQGYVSAYADESCVYHPARSSLKEVHKKICRVEGSRFRAKLDKIENRSTLTVGTLSILVKLRPPLRSAIYKSFLEPKIQKPQHKIRIFLFVVTTHYAVMADLLRIFLGGAQRRE